MSSNISMDNRLNKWHDNDFTSTFTGRGTYPLANQVVYYSALNYLGNVQGKTLLDVACGEGDFCRLVKAKGASRVMGVDISTGFVDYAKKQSSDCEYQFGNAFDLGMIDKFDFVSANRLISYAETAADLKLMCRGFYDNLKDGGRFVGVGFNCFAEPNWGSKIAHFGFKSFTPLPLTAEAKRIEVLGPENENGESLFRYIFFYFDSHVYEEAFKDAGFRTFSFKPTLIDKSVPQPEGFWDVFEENPHLLCYVAEK